MLQRLAHTIASNPVAYDLIQRAAGVEVVHRRLAATFERLDLRGLLLDVGGGTGIIRFLWQGRGRYVCLDLDPLKLRGYRAKFPAEPAVLADATRLPFADASADVVLCKFLTHHLDDAAVARLMRECRRALKPAGGLVVVDPVWSPSRRIAKLMWKYDRGSFPRTAGSLESLIRPAFPTVEAERFAVWHEYALLIARG